MVLERREANARCGELFATAIFSGLIALVVTAGACGAQKPKPQNARPPEGIDVAPVVVEVSAFWGTLDEVVCTKVIAGSRPRDMPDEDWNDLHAYCSAASASKPRLILAEQADRDEILQWVINGTKPGSVNLKPLCEKTKAALPTPDANADSKVDPALQEFAEVCKSSMHDAASLQGFADAFEQIRDSSDPRAATLKRFAEEADKLVGAGSRGAAVAAAGAPLGSLATTMVDSALRGLAQFLVKRAELELRTYAIGRMRDVAQCGNDTPQSRLLANTCQFLGSSTGKLNDGFGPGLRTAFANDLIMLPRNIVREAPAKGGKRELFVRVALESAAVLLEDPEPMQIVVRIEKLASGTPLPGEAFECDTDQTACNEAKAGLYLAAVIAREILTDGRQIRLTAEVLFARLRGRLEDLIENLPPSTTLATNIKALHGQLTEDQSLWSSLVRQLHDDGAAAIASFQEARRALGAVPADATPEMIAKAATLATRHALRGLDRSLAIASCMAILAAKKQPGDCTTSHTQLPGRLADFMDALHRSDFAAVMAAGLDLAQGALGTTRFEVYITPDVARLLSFGAELANAKTKEDAEAAIEAVAMSPGGYKEKRKRSFGSITGLVGLGAGIEHLAGQKDDYAGMSSLVGAVGFDYNWHFDHPWTIGVFVPVLDLGGLLNFRFETNEVVTEETAPIGFGQVFAPGIGVRLGIHDTPLVLMLGAQVVPNGRTVLDDNGTANDTTDDTTDEKSVYRALISLAVDVTIWSF